MKYAIYCRKSTDTEDKQLLSLESQEQELLALAKRNQLNVVTILRESMTAKEPGRPIFGSLLSEVSKGHIDAILCWKIDRLTRNPIDGGQIQWLLQSGKIKCIQTFDKCYYPNDNVLLMNIEQAMATQYIRDLSINVKRGNRTKLEKGEWPHKAPFGYINDKSTKTIKIHGGNSKYVSRAFELYATGVHTLKEISETLYAEGLRTPGGNKLGKGHIHRILLTSFYCGRMESHGNVYIGNHIPLVSVDVYNKVQDILHGRKHPRPKKHFYPARGFLNCATCGCTLTADTKKGHVYYYCTNGKGICQEHTKYLRSEFVDELLSTILQKISFETEFIAGMVEAYKQKYKNKEVDMQDFMSKLAEEKSNLLTKESLLVEGYSSSIIREEIYTEKIKQIHLKRTELDIQIKEIEARKHRPSVTFEQVKNVLITAYNIAHAYLQAPEEDKRNMLQTVLSNIAISNQKIVKYQLKSPYDLLLKVPKNANLRTMLALWDDIRKAILTNPLPKNLQNDNEQRE